MDEKLLTIDEVAEYLQVSVKTIYRMIQRKEIPCYKIANQWRFKSDRVQEWLEKDAFQAPRESGKRDE